MHRMYTESPPHDDELYQILGISPKATMAEISKAYRRKSRLYHPDKTRGKSEEQNLQEIRRAFEVLQNDKTRLIYHRYGLMGDTSVAAHLLTGSSSSKSLSREQRKLMHLMGYGPKILNPNTRHEQRVLFLAANICETIRPLVEQTVSEQVFAHQMAQECQVLKKLPLGAQVIRCVGRAYRHSGQRALSQSHVASTVKHWKRATKDLFTAALVSTKLALKEHKLANINKKQKQTMDPIEYYDNDNDLDDWLGSDADETNFTPQTDEQIAKQEHTKAQHAVVEALQVEALWKISKIELDRTIQEACDLIASGSYQGMFRHDGWVSSVTGKVIEKQVAKVRAAKALVLMGDILVQCSKQGTAWKE